MKVRKIEDFGHKPDPEIKSVRQIRIRHSDIEEQNLDPFMRHWIMFKKFGKIRLGSDYEGHLERMVMILVRIAMQSPEGSILPVGSRT